MTVTICKI